MSAQLKLYRDNDVEEEIAPYAVEDKVHIRLGDLLPLVAMAQRRHFTWLQDFLDDEIGISSDLHDVLIAFRSVRPSA